ncbi:carboxypeptidase E [Paragonimus westermani]|uniref:Carboxypeptidase E n=1 Tax=Paragonimus westermani TaxID=34504 RepID=A0A5J4N5W8_9TREM|nr:carboxypeptidase E [Paragonimus westermani]
METSLKRRLRLNMASVRSAYYHLFPGMQDYSYLDTNAFELTVELGCTKFPEPSWLPMYWEQNRISLLNFMTQVHRGVKGMIYGFDGVSVLPLSKVIVRVFNSTLPGEPLPITHNIWSGEDGDYYRLLTRGRFILMYEAPGFDTAVACVDISHVPSWEHGFQPAQTINVLLLNSDLKDESVDSKDLLEKPVDFHARSRKPLVCSSDQEE